jgi:hypothetical protein
MPVSGDVKVVSYDPRVCSYDNGTAVCDLGHKIRNIGMCYSQSIGTYNSTDDTFQPTYSICSSDYLSLTNSFFVESVVSYEVEGSSKLAKDSGDSGLIKEIVRSVDIDKVEFIAVKSITKSPFDAFVEVLLDSVGDSFNQLIRDASVSCVQKLIQHDSGYVLRADNTTSDYFHLDVFGYTSVVQPFYYVPKLSTVLKIVSIDDVLGNYNQIYDIFKLGVTNPSSGLEDNPTSICVGDLVEPSLENVSPAQSAHLVTDSESISFDVVDAIGGVDKSSVYITVSGNQTPQAGGISVVEAGVAQNEATQFNGTKYRYSFLYNPPIDWASNETVTITITGTDLVPEVGGSPFSCYEGDPNPFGDEWYYQVENKNDFSCSIVAVADSSAPYLENIFPLPFYGYNAYDGNISFDIVDDLSGVDLNTVDIYINGSKVIDSGSSVNSGAALTGIFSRYSFSFDNTSGFSYGSRVVVRVVASDLYSAAPNILDYEYYYDVVDDGSLVIENFLPEVGITWNPETVDISVDVKDLTYDVDGSATYLSINGTICSAAVADLWDNRYLTATVSGITSLSGTWINDANVYESTITNASIAGSLLSGGSILAGSGVGGYVGGWSDPFSNTISGSLISSYLYEGVVTSGTIETVLVSGINWDGKYTNSTVTDIDLSSFYSTSTSCSGLVISGTVGKRLTYHPPNDFNYGSPINVLVHGENLSSVSKVIKEQEYRLLYGYNVKSFDSDFGHNEQINVFVSAKNREFFTNELNQGFYFFTIDQPSENLGASINGIAPWENFPASIEPQAPVHKYGKLMVIELYAEDVNGNILGPYSFSYTIEEAP